MTIPLWGYVAAGSLLTGTLAGWTVRDWKADSDALAAQEKAEKRYEQRVNDLAQQSLRFEQMAQTIRASERKDRETIREIYNEVKVPAECAVPAGAVSVLDNAIRDANAAATGKPRDNVPDAP